MFQRRETKSGDTLFDSDRESELPDSNSELFNLDAAADLNYDDMRGNLRCKTPAKSIALQKLRVAKLDSISIPPTVKLAPPIVNLRQSFTFPAAFKPCREIATQTSQINLMTSVDKKLLQRPIKRPTSLPPENIALTNLQNRVDVKPKNAEEVIGDGVANKTGEIFDELLVNGFRKPDLELADCIPPVGVQRVLIKPK